MGNKSDEITCLDLAVKECSKQHGFSKKIAKLLSAKDIEREFDERPDFLKCYAPENRNEKRTIIGIEHFRIDHYSKELSNNRVGSFGIGYEKSLKSATDTWETKIKEFHEIPDGALVDMGNLIKQLLELRMQATYNTFIEAFKYTLNKHIQSIDTYYSAINKYSEKCDKKLAFLIEVHSGFDDLFFHDRKGIHHNENTIPMFDELVNILEKIDSRKVHYLIFCFGGIVYNENVKVLAIPTCNLRKKLIKRHIPIYHYAGHDIFLSRFQTPRQDMKTTAEYQADGENIHFKVSVNSREIKEVKQLEMIMDCYAYIKDLEKLNYYYATTDLVEMFYYCYDEYYPLLFDKSRKANTDMPAIIMQGNKEKFDVKFEEYKNKWNLGENDAN